MTADPRTKRCSRCRIVKPLDDFHRRREAVDGRQPNCKPCALESQRAGRRRGAELAEAARRVGEAVQLFERASRQLLGAVQAAHEAAQRVADELERTKGAA